ncbi:MAG: hypothetical protein OSJ68_02090 [Clostridia bacterium]|nr:hypothetical protein [Clostridia bacterium]
MIVMNTNDLIGLEVCAAESKLREKGITNFKFVYYVDRKQNNFDKYFVSAVLNKSDGIELIVCRYLFRV